MKRNIPLIETEEEAEEAIHTIKTTLEKKAALQAAHVEYIKKLKAQLKAQEEALAKSQKEADHVIDDHFLGVYRFARMRRPALTRGKQSARLVHGSKVKWLETVRVMIKNKKRAGKFVTENKHKELFDLKVILKKIALRKYIMKGAHVPGVQKVVGENFLIYPKGMEKPISRRVAHLDAVLSPKPRAKKEGHLAMAA